MRRFLGAMIAVLAGCGGGGGSGDVGPDVMPTVASVQPPGGPVTGGTDVVVTGTGFAAGATVQFGGAAATSVVRVSSTELRARTPAHAAGAVTVAVVNPSNRQQGLPNGFTFAAPPLAVAPGELRAPPGTPVVIDGSGTTDPSNLPVTWRWSVTSAPAGSTATLSGATTSVATLVPDLPGAYGVDLVVTNPGGPSTPAHAVVRTIASGSILPDSGQSTCYDAAAPITCPASGAAWFGQDAQYVIRPVSFGSGGGMVSDPVTGLTWALSDGGAKHNWYEAAGVADPTYNPGGAVDVCGQLGLGGHADWRLPTVRELFSLVRETAFAGPQIDGAAFPGTHAGLDGRYWTSTEFSPTAPPWAVDFGSGTTTYGYGDRYTGLWVRCVRGPAWGASAFVDQGDGTVRDDGTGLTWEQAPPSTASNWAGALARCEGLALAGGGWRLPSASELGTLFDTTTISPAIDTTLFAGTTGFSYWTSTTVTFYPANAYTGLPLFGELGDGNDKGSSLFSRCVR